MSFGDPSARAIEVFLIVSQSAFEVFLIVSQSDQIKSPTSRAFEVFLIGSLGTNRIGCR